MADRLDAKELGECPTVFCASRDDKAPMFTASAFVGGQIKKINLDDFKGRWVLLFFYPSDFTFV